MARCSHRLVKTTLVDARHGDRLEHSLPSSQSFWAFNFQAFSKSAWSCPESGCMKSNVLSLGRAVAVLRRIGGARRLCFQWTGGQHESQHDFDFLLKCLGHSHIEPAVEEGSSHFSCQSCVLWGKTMYEKFSGDLSFSLVISCMWWACRRKGGPWPVYCLDFKEFPGSVALWQKKGRVFEGRSLKSKCGGQASVKMVAADVPIWADEASHTSGSSVLFFPKPCFGPWVDVWLHKKIGRSCLLIKLRSDNRSLTGRNASLGIHWFSACDLPW